MGRLRLHVSSSKPLNGRSRDGSVGVATVYGLDGQVSIPGRGKILSSTASRPALEPTQPPI
jgi:hypothetical protein